MFDGIFHEWMNQKSRQLTLFRRRLEVISHVELVFESNFLDGQIILDRFDFLTEFNERRIVVQQRITQELRKLRHHALGPLTIFVNGSSNRIERVEEKVRVQL